MDKDLTLFLCNSDNDAAREDGAPATAAAAAGAGDPGDAGRPLRAVARRDRPAHTPSDRRPHPRRRTFCTAAADDILGGRLAVEHLVERGPARVAFVGGPCLWARCATPRRAAAAWAEAGLPEATSSRPPTRSPSPRPRRGGAAGRAATAEATDGRVLRQRPGRARSAPQAIRRPAGAGGPRDRGVRRHRLRRRGCRPAHLGASAPPELGRAAAALLLDEATNPDHVHEQITFTPELVARDSTRS